MTAPGKNDDDPQDFSDSDRQWFDRLSGKLVVAKDEAALREADALRLALATERAAAEADPAIAAANTPEEGELRWQQLQFHLKREGLLDKKPAPRKTSKTIWQATAALAAAIVLTVALLPRPGNDGPWYDEPPTVRGDVVLVQRQDASPRQAAEALASSLKASGLQPQIYQLGKTFTVEIELTPDADAAALAAVEQAGLVAKMGFTRVEIAPK